MLIKIILKIKPVPTYSGIISGAQTVVVNYFLYYCTLKCTPV